MKYNKINRENVEKMINILQATYNDAKCSLNYSSPFELTIALILAAQSTDATVNIVVPKLLKKFPNPDDLGNASVGEVEKIIKPTGFYHSKAKYVIATSKILSTVYKYEFPDTFEKLAILPGIGRKSSNIILQECFGKVEGIAVDTHVTRLSYKIGLTKNKEANKIEKDLVKQINKKYWDKINHIFVYHGRAICIARKPQCDICPINNICMKN